MAQIASGLRLYMNPNDPEKTTLVSANGIAHYAVTTTQAHPLAPRVLRIRRPADTEDGSFVADIEWRRFGAHPVVRSHVFDGSMLQLELREFLYKLGHKFTPTRYFLGNDGKEYRWKTNKDIGNVLIHCETANEIARFSEETVTDGFFRGQRKWCLHVQPTTLDIDMIVTTFIIMEKRRRDRVAADGMRVKDRDEDVAEGGCEGGTG